MEKIKEYLEETRSKFQEYIDQVKKKKIKLLNPRTQGEVMASAGVISYINVLLAKIESGDFN